MRCELGGARPQQTAMREWHGLGRASATRPAQCERPTTSMVRHLAPDGSGRSSILHEYVNMTAAVESRVMPDVAALAARAAEQAAEIAEMEALVLQLEQDKAEAEDDLYDLVESLKEKLAEIHPGIGDRVSLAKFVAFRIACSPNTSGRNLYPGGPESEPKQIWLWYLWTLGPMGPASP